MNLCEKIYVCIIIRVNDIESNDRLCLFVRSNALPVAADDDISESGR